MSVDDAENLIKDYAADCSMCGDCLEICPMLDELGLTPGEIAQAVLEDRVGETTLAAIQRCDLCGRCARDCALDLYPSHLIKAAREVLVQKGQIHIEDYDVMLVDRDWNFFTLYRESNGIHYDDLKAEHAERIFFPGCTLASYAPELTRAAFSWLKDQGTSIGFTDLCCGKPLDSLGLSAATERNLDHLRQQITSLGARELITACPNCHAHLQTAHLPGVTVRSIYAMLLEAGVQLSGNQTLTFHDSCPDRENDENPTHIRTLLGGYPQVEMAHHGKDTICCGSGGIVSTIDPDLATKRAMLRMAEYTASGADTCVTSCMACSQRLARVSAPSQVRHCLEYVFNIQIDYAQVERNTQALWEGSQGEVNLQRLANARVMPLKE